MTYYLLNYYKDEKRESASNLEMKAKTATELLTEIVGFVEDGHSPYILKFIENTVYHIGIKEIAEWMKNPKTPLHIATETYRGSWKPLIFELTTHIH